MLLGAHTPRAVIWPQELMFPFPIRVDVLLAFLSPTHSPSSTAQVVLHECRQLCPTISHHCCVLHVLSPPYSPSLRELSIFGFCSGGMARTSHCGHLPFFFPSFEQAGAQLLSPHPNQRGKKSRARFFRPLPYPLRSYVEDGQHAFFPLGHSKGTL